MASLTGPTPQLPPSSLGHLPAVVSDEDQGKFRVLSRFEVPALLSETQLAEQIGADRVDDDPMWFLYDPRRLPCFRRAATLGGLSGAIVGASVLWRTRAVAGASLAGMTTWLGVFSLAWVQCRAGYRAQKRHDATSALSLVQDAPAEARGDK